MKQLYLFALLLCWVPAHGQQADSIVLRNAVLYYYTYGAGEPIILLSGGPGVASHQEDDVASELGKHYRAILFDQRGTGKSWTKPLDSSTINLDQAVADLETLRQHLQLARLNLYGHSWGSMLAAAYIARFPKRVGLFISVGGGELDTRYSEVVNDNVRAATPAADTASAAYWRRPAVVRQDPARAAHEARS